jgi:2-polyprenyl-3-methyl-5-hydroxy-6-metoxy-1,4-benzoquinol methylase
MAIIDKNWPQNHLEKINHCPYCLSEKKRLSLSEVQDWTFQSSPGKWFYFECLSCGALYLNPRPTESSISKAYRNYYTHNVNFNSLKEKLKTLIRNEIYSEYLKHNIHPRLNISKPFCFLLTPFKYLLNIPYELNYLKQLPKGKLLDVGCGSGKTLKIAQQLGWKVYGIEIDRNAVKSARRDGLEVTHASYEDLKKFNSEFDCVICSHVLEHVYQPLKLIKLISERLKPGGVLLLSLPNAQSHMQLLFKECWRGLEAPRHIAIPTLDKIIKILTKNKFVAIQQINVYGATYLASCRILKKSRRESILDFLRLKLFLSIKYQKENVNSDFIQIIAHKKNG